MHSGRTSGSTDYAKLSLYLGVVSVIGAGAYWYWQFTNAKAERRYRAKYLEARNAIKEVQEAYGLLPTGHLDESTRALLSSFGAANAKGT
jgi:hypothetical protein